MKHLGDPCPARRVSKVPAAVKYRGVAERAGAHGVTLSCDGVGSGTRFTDVAGHQRQIDDRLGGPHRLIALIDAHGPPEGYPLSTVDEFDQFQDLFFGQPCASRAPLQRIRFRKLFKLLKMFRMLLNEPVVQIIFLYQKMGDGVQEKKITSPSEPIPVIGVHGRLRASRVNDDDLVIRHLILPHPAPENRMRHHRVRPDKNNPVGQFQIL